jgi:4-hydroxybenzoate polyprenyltransferase
MSTIKNYLSLVKFSHTIFAMPFALIGYFIGVYYYNTAIPGRDQLIYKLILVIACMVLARSSAMAFNRYLDRKIDAKNPRTASREIPAGIISSGQALAFTIICSVLFMVAAYLINLTCFYLSPLALAVILGYSYTKRFTWLCHLILGLGLSLAPIGAFLAVTGEFRLLPVLFSFAVLTWVSGFDIIYALQDVEFDRSEKLYSIPAWLGKSKALRVSEILHALSIACVIIAGWWAGFGWLYWIGALIFTVMLIYQHSIVSPENLKRVNLAFMTANGIASFVFAIFVIAELLIH